MNLKFDVDMPRFRQIENATLEDAKKVLFLSMSKMEELAKRRCPVDSGLLRASIKLSPRTIGSKSYVLSDGVHYGVYVEYGTKRMEAAHGKHDPKNPVTDWEAKRKRSAVGQTMPFMRPAMLEVKKIWVPKYWKQILSKK